MDRPLYLLPFRVVVGAAAGVLVVGLLAGAFGGWLTARRLLRLTPSGERVVERVEQVTVSAEDALANAAATIAPSVVAVLDGRGRTVAAAVALTNDGVLVGTGPAPAATVRIRRVAGEVTEASVVRVYPEFGLYLLRAAGEYAAPALERDASLRPGTAVVAVARTPDGSGYRVREARIESDGLSGGDLARALPALARVPSFLSPLPASYRGAPVVGVNGRLLGLALVEGSTSRVVPGGVVDRLLRDTLEHRAETVVTVQSTLQGSWRTETKAEGPHLVFRVARGGGPTPAQGESVRPGDDIVAIRDEALQGPAPLALALLEAARKNETLPVTVRRGEQMLPAAIVASIR